MGITGLDKYYYTDKFSRKTDIVYNRGKDANTADASKNDDFAGIAEAKGKSRLSAKDFLSTLTPQELYIIQKANGLAGQISVSNISDEGAENLFLKPLGKDKLVDLNNDGIEEVGEAKIAIFPPPNAPDSVKKAWEEVTGDLSFEDKMKLNLRIIAKQVESNYYIDANGKAAIREPGEAGWKNIFGNTEESYITLFNNIIERIDNPLAARDSKQIKDDEFVKRVLLDVISLIRK